jgi:hypothetical protein
LGGERSKRTNEAQHGYNNLKILLINDCSGSWCSITSTKRSVEAYCESSSGVFPQFYNCPTRSEIWWVDLPFVMAMMILKIDGQMFT